METIIDDVAFEKWFKKHLSKMSVDEDKKRMIHRYAYAGWFGCTAYYDKKRSKGKKNIK